MHEELPKKEKSFLRGGTLFFFRCDVNICGGRFVSPLLSFILSSLLPPITFLYTSIVCSAIFNQLYFSVICICKSRFSASDNGFSIKISSFSCRSFASPHLKNLSSGDLQLPNSAFCFVESVGYAVTRLCLLDLSSLPPFPFSILIFPLQDSALNAYD